MRSEPSETGAINEVDPTAGFGKVGFHSVAANCANDTALGSLDAASGLRSLFEISIICLIGVMPAIGSLENGKN